MCNNHIKNSFQEGSFTTSARPVRFITEVCQTETVLLTSVTKLVNQTGRGIFTGATSPCNISLFKLKINICDTFD